MCLHMPIEKRLAYQIVQRQSYSYIYWDYIYNYKLYAPNVARTIMDNISTQSPRGDRQAFCGHWLELHTKLSERLGIQHFSVKLNKSWEQRVEKPVKNYILTALSFSQIYLMAFRLSNSFPKRSSV